jgi:hypothetical protein
MSKQVLTSLFSSFILLATGLSLSIDPSGSWLETILQLIVMVVAVAWRITDRDQDGISDYFQPKSKEDTDEQED